MCIAERNADYIEVEHSMYIYRSTIYASVCCVTANEMPRPRHATIYIEFPATDRELRTGIIKGVRGAAD